MKLRNKKSHMTGLPEGLPPRNMKPRITQIIYYIILASTVGYLIFIFGSRIFYFKEQGFVEINKTVISASHGGKILKLAVKEGQNIKRNALLAIINSARNCFTSTDNQYNKLAYEYALNRIKLNAVNQSINDLEKLLTNDKLMRALETGQSQRTPLSKVKLDIYNKQADVVLLKHKMALQKQQINMLKHNPSKTNKSPECYNESISSPFNGTVHSVKSHPSEFASRGEALLILVNEKAPVRIEFYLASDQLSSLKKGNIVNVSFPDGVSTKAVIKSIYSAAYDFTDREWALTTPLEIKVRVHLEPINTQDADIWKRYDRMEVVVRGRK